jgi:hypothetical protein
LKPIALSFEQQLDIELAIELDEYNQLDADEAAYISWFINGGEIPSGKILARTCAESRCVNPDHLIVIDPPSN